MLDSSHLIRTAAIVACLALLGSFAGRPAVHADEGIEEVEMSGYLLVPHEKVPERFDAGFSMYVAAWPLVRNYPGNRFQTGLFGTWMFARQEEPKPKNIYSDIEGGLGWWRDTRFATETPKFIMGGVTLEFDEWANGPGAGKSRDWNAPLGVYGVAQLSPRIVWPADGLNLAQGTCGELFGYGYLPLPLTDPQATTAGKPIPTGNQSWTLFVSAANFKGPIAFFLTDLSLSVRARKCTTKLGIGTIGELIRRTAEDLMECKNFGVTSLNEVREKLAERGLKLRGD